MNQNRIIPIYTSRGDAEAFLSYPHLFNRNGDWIGFITADKKVYSVLGYYVGEITGEPRIIRKRINTNRIARMSPPTRPARMSIPATFPLAPLMADLRFGYIDVLLDEPDLLHTIDSGELSPDLD